MSEEKPTWQSIEREFRQATAEARAKFEAVVRPLKAKRDLELADLHADVVNRRNEARSEMEAAHRRYQSVLHDTRIFARAKERAIDAAYSGARAPAFRIYKKAVAPAESEKRRKWRELYPP